MRKTALLAAAIITLSVACNSQRAAFNGPTVDAFNGKVVVDGNPVSFPPGEEVILRVYHHGSGKSWGIPLQPDGTFKIGWMPVGTYNSVLNRASKNTKGRGTNLYPVPGTFSIAEGQTEYVIDLGKGFKP
jgi:hypothetical protein